MCGIIFPSLYKYCAALSAFLLFLSHSLSLYINVCAYIHTYLNVYLSTYVSTYLCLYVYMHLCIFAYLYMYLSIKSDFMYLYIYVCISVYLSVNIYLSICLTISQSIYLSVDLSICWWIERKKIIHVSVVCLGRYTERQLINVDYTKLLFFLFNIV